MANYWYDHVHLTSLDPEKTAEFYMKLFGAKMVANRKMPDGRTSIEIELQGSSILIMYPHIVPDSALGEPVTPFGLEHFGIKTDDIEAAVADLKANEVKFRDEIREARPGIWIAYFWAPENVLIELLERREA